MRRLADASNIKPADAAAVLGITPSDWLAIQHGDLERAAELDLLALCGLAALMKLPLRQLLSDEIAAPLSPHAGTGD